MRDENGVWQQLESYLAIKHDNHFTRGMCEGYAEKALADLNSRD